MDDLSIDKTLSMTLCLGCFIMCKWFKQCLEVLGEGLLVQVLGNIKQSPTRTQKHACINITMEEQHIEASILPLLHGCFPLPGKEHISIDSLNKQQYMYKTITNKQQYIYRQTTISKQQPAASKQQPATSYQQQETSNKQHATSNFIICRHLYMSVMSCLSCLYVCLCLKSDQRVNMHDCPYIHVCLHSFLQTLLWTHRTYAYTYMVLHVCMCIRRLGSNKQ